MFENESVSIPERDMALIEQIVSSFRDRLFHLYTVAHLEGQTAAVERAIDRIKEPA